MALACDCSYVTFNHGVRREKNEKAQLLRLTSTYIGEVEEQKITLGPFGGHRSPINNKQFELNLKTKAYP